MINPSVIWHDIECGGYAEDLPVYRELAAAVGGPVLDIGAGTGRVSLDLARAGHEVVALDLDPDLLAAMRERAEGLPVETICADARAFDLGRRFELIIVPMQSIQLLGERYPDLVACAAAHLLPGGRLAIAVANPPPYDGELTPLPDMREDDGWLWASHPVALRSTPEGLVIDRVREIVGPDGSRTVDRDEVVLTRITPEDLEAAGAPHGLVLLDIRDTPETDDYVGSDVVILGA